MDASIRDTSGNYQPWVDKVEIEQMEGDEKEVGTIYFRDTIRPLLIDGPLNILLFCVPISLICYAADGPYEVTFIFGVLALAPLAERLSFITEQVAMHTNETIAGLVNVTFGNAVELIVSISALVRGLYRLVQLSLLGSILSNMLLVLGCALWAGGIYHTEQKFGTISSQMNSTLLMLAVTAIMLPTILTYSSQESELGELGYSRGTSIMLFFLYFGFIYFQLYSHKHLYDDDSSSKNTTPKPQQVKTTAYNAISHSSSHPEGGGEAAVADVEQPTVAADSSVEAPGVKGETTSDGGDEDEEEDVLGYRNAVIWLGLMTVLVILGWMMNHDLSLNFGTFEAMSLLLTVISVTFAIKDGTSNWLLGLTLVITYGVVALGFWAHRDEDLDEKL